MSHGQQVLLLVISSSSQWTKHLIYIFIDKKAYHYFPGKIYSISHDANLSKSIHKTSVWTSQLNEWNMNNSKNM